MSIKIGNYFYVVTFPDQPLYRVETLVLDANVVGHLYDWALGKRTKVSRSQIQPLLELVRGVKFVEYVSGVLESSWGVPKNASMGRSNYDHIRLNDFRLKVRAIDTIVQADTKTFNSWLEEGRNSSIPFIPFDESRARGLIRDEEEFRIVAQVVMKDWVGFLSMLKYLRDLWDCDDIDLLIEGFRSWRDELHNWKAPISAIPTYLAKIGFFGGSIRSRFFVQEEKLWRDAKIYNREMLFKREEWAERGLVRLARNLAFDAHAFYERQMWESGYVPWGFTKENPVKCEKSVTGIVTADQGINAINSMIQSANPLESPLSGYRVQYPKDSKLSRHLSESEIGELFSFVKRAPSELLDSNQLVTIAESLMDELTRPTDPSP